MIPPLERPSDYPEQPPPDQVLIDDIHALLEERWWKQLREYSCSIPSGVIPGKMWKCSANRKWFLCWFGPVANGRCAVHARKALVLSNPAPPIRELSGFRDKLYWRPVGPARIGPWCCFKKSEDGGYVSLCGRNRKERSGGQSCRRPAPHLRCGSCDGREMDRRGWTQIGPESPK